MSGKEQYLGEFEHTLLLVMLHDGGRQYGAQLRQNLKSLVARDVSIGALYVTLDRLEKKGYITVSQGKPTPERGGRAKRYFEVSAEGQRVLKLTRSMFENLWQGVSL